jgi:phage protein D
MMETKTYVPIYRIKIKHKEFKMGENLDIQSVSIREHTQGADTFTIKVIDKHSQWKEGYFFSKVLMWTDDGLFEEGNEVEIRLGYLHDFEDHYVKLMGEITGCEIDFPQSGPPTLTVEGKSFYRWLQESRPKLRFQNKTISQIAEYVAEKVGLESEVEPTQIKQSANTGNMTAAAFLEDLAKRILWEVTVKEKRLIFRSPRVKQTHKVTLEWGKSLLSFNPRISIHNKPSKVIVRSNRTEGREGTKGEIVGVATSIREKAMGEVTSVEVAKKRKNKSANITSRANPDQKTAKQIAQFQLEGLSLDFISGSGKCIGNPSIRAGIIIELKDLGEKFSGLYYVDTVTHTISESGYLTNFTVKRNARGGRL